MTRTEYRKNLALALAEVMQEIKTKLAPELLETLFKKNLDYVPDENNPFRTFENAALLAGIDGGERVLISRLGDKFERLQNLMNSGKPPQVEDESIIDTLRDISGYSIIGIVMLRQYQKLNSESWNDEVTGEPV